MSGILSISSPINDLQQSTDARYGISAIASIKASGAKNVSAEDAAMDAAMLRELDANGRRPIAIRRRMPRGRRELSDDHQRHSRGFYVPTNERLEDEDKATIDSYA